MIIQPLLQQNDGGAERLAAEARHRVEESIGRDQEMAQREQKNTVQNFQQREDDELLDRDTARTLASAMESYASAMGSQLKFNLDDKRNVLQVEVIDPATDKVIRKIPPDELVDLASSLEKATGIMMNRMF